MFFEITGETKGVACGELVESGVGETTGVGVFRTTSPLFLESIQPTNTTTKTIAINNSFFILIRYQLFL